MGGKGKDSSGKGGGKKSSKSPFKPAGAKRQDDWVRSTRFRLMGVRMETPEHEDPEERWELAAKGTPWTTGSAEQSPSPAEAFRTARMDLATTPAIYEPMRWTYIVKGRPIQASLFHV